MDVSYFLRNRTAFVRQLYDNASSPFVERKRKIETEEEPFVPPYSEDGEPAFLKEWQEAEESLHILGVSCVSMLSAALHLYFRTWEDNLNIPAREAFKAHFKKGMIHGYKAYFKETFGIDWDKSGCDLLLLEELVLARNRAQHPDSIFNHTVAYGVADLQKIRKPFFASDSEVEILAGMGGAEKLWFSSASVQVTPEKLHHAIEQVDSFCDWLENQITDKIYRG